GGEIHGGARGGFRAGLFIGENDGSFRGILLSKLFGDRVCAFHGIKVDEICAKFPATGQLKLCYAKHSIYSNSIEISRLLTLWVRAPMEIASTPRIRNVLKLDSSMPPETSYFMPLRFMRTAFRTKAGVMLSNRNHFPPA